MKINSKNFLAFNLHSLDKQMITNSYVNGTQLHSKELRKMAIENYLTETDKNYLLTKSAISVIENIKFTNNPEIRRMIIDMADESATLLIDKECFFRYYKDVSGNIACIYVQEYVIENMEEKLGKSFDKEAVLRYFEQHNYPKEKFNKSYKWDAFNIREDAIENPKLDEGHEMPMLEFFLKAMIFIKCTNVEAEVLSPRPDKPKRIKVDSEKYLLDVDKDVTLVNAKYNKLVIRNEEFWVNPHGRFQRCGREFKNVKYIIIDGYYKKGYKREYK